MYTSLKRQNVKGTVWCGSCQKTQPAVLLGYQQVSDLQLLGGCCLVCHGPVCRLNSDENAFVPVATLSNVEHRQSGVQLLSLSGILLLGIALLL